MKYKMFRFDGQDFNDTYVILASEEHNGVAERMTPEQAAQFSRTANMGIAHAWTSGQILHDECEQVCDANDFNVDQMRKSKCKTFLSKFSGYATIGENHGNE